DDQAVSAAADTPLNIVLAGADVDGDSLIFSVVNGPTHGVLAGTAPNLVYTPTTRYHGADSFTFKTNDGHTDSPLATVQLTVGGPNHTPVASNQTVTTTEGTAVNLTLTGLDDDGDSLTFHVVNASAHGV